MFQSNRSNSKAKLGRGQIALIHVAKSRIGMSEEAYRDMLGSFGVESSKDLLQSQFWAVMDRFEAGGFVGSKAPRVHKSAKASGMHKPVAADRVEMVAKIGAILTDLKLPWSYADGVAKQMFRVDLLRFCDVAQTQKVMQALIKRQRRLGREPQ